MITLELEEDNLELIKNRLRYWTSDEESINLFMKYYENFIFSGCLEEIRIDIKFLVDNDYINNYYIDSLSNYKDSINYAEDRIACYNKDLDLCLIRNQM